MMCRALGWQDEADALSADTPGFADVPVGSLHWAAATLLKQKGILLGYGDTAGDATRPARSRRAHQAAACRRDPLQGPRSSSLIGHPVAKLGRQSHAGRGESTSSVKAIALLLPLPASYFRARRSCPDGERRHATAGQFGC